MKNVTIKDIAKLAGVSRGTVDRVINNRGNVSKLVEERIIKIAKEIGYEKNIIASRLASTKTYKIAVVLPDPESDFFWNIPKEGILSAINLVKYYRIQVRFYEYNISSSEEFVNKVTEAIEDKPEAILMAPLFLKESEKLMGIGEKKGIPFITINSELNHKNILSFTGQSSYHSGYLAGKLFDVSLEHNDEVLVLNLAHKISNAPHYTDKVKGLIDYFKKHKTKHIHVSQYEFDDFLNEKILLEKFRATQKKHPGMKGIFFTNSRAYRLLDLLEIDEVKKYKIIGFDMIEQNVNYLKKGDIDFIIHQNPYNQGYNGLMNFVNHFVLDKEIKKKEYLPLDIVVKENVNFYYK